MSGSQPSAALAQLERLLGGLPAEQPLTAGTLLEVVTKAREDAQYSEWEDYMGEGL